MNKLQIEVYLPAALRSFDVRVPADMKLAQVTQLVAVVSAFQFSLLRRRRAAALRP